MGGPSNRPPLESLRVLQTVAAMVPSIFGSGSGGGLVVKDGFYQHGLGQSNRCILIANKSFAADAI
jgi:hypothetical protein